MASPVSSVPSLCTSPSGSPDPWAAVPMFGFLVGAKGPGVGAVTGSLAFSVFPLRGLHVEQGNAEKSSDCVFFTEVE
ncbi:hypothetical protein Taro_017434 [Colocasia esculenta]|uniref:Uncharacterized protein n=1 Tax=Colocasia esculenta TaxID=4460 RepID=A0A843UT85_COLES|nr:hypothetical protein [Colocasia esculenta]